MQIPLKTSTQKRTLIAGIAVLVLLYSAWAGIRFAASLYADRPTLASLQRAVRLDPGNADYHHHLGRFYAMVLRDPGSAVTQYLSAVALNPHEARYWFDLSSAYQVLGDQENQAQALERAVEADPMTPDVAWEAANLHLVEGQTDKALSEFKVVLANDIGLTNQSVLFCWRVLPDVDALLDHVIPPKTEAYVALLTLLTTKDDQVAGTKKVWAALVKSGQPFELRYALDYINYLLLHQEVQEAALVWQQSAQRFNLVSYLPSASNLVVNPQFSFDILNGGLDWHYQKQPGVKLTLDPGEFHAGSRSLLINFDGPGIRDAGIYQIIPVQPSTAYTFSGYYKSGDFEGAGGPHFTIQDFYHQDVLYETDELKDAAYWTQATGEFKTGPQSQAVLLEVRRLPDGAPIRGKLWIDDFQITRK